MSVPRELQDQWELDFEVIHGMFDNAYERPVVCQNCGAHGIIHVKQGVKIKNINTQPILAQMRCTECGCSGDVGIVPLPGEEKP